MLTSHGQEHEQSRFANLWDFGQPAIGAQGGNSGLVDGLRGNMLCIQPTGHSAKNS
jgi:hypothetical protein